MKLHAPALPPELSHHLVELRDRPPTAAIEEIAAVVTQVLHSLKGDLNEGSVRLFVELEDRARYIINAKQEIAALSPDEITEKHLRGASDELDAIVGATEEATHVILQSMEALQAIPDMSPEVAEKVNSAVTEVFEACNFQDVTGQRITKVVKALNHIEDKVQALIAAFGDEIQRFKKTREEAVVESAPSAAKDDKSLHHGPQLPADAAKQEDIDALLASFD